MQPIWSKKFTALTVDLTAIYSRSYSDCKQTKISDLAFCVKSPGLFWVFFPCARTFSLIYGFRNGLVFIWCFSKLLTLKQSKKWSNIWQYLAVSEISVVSKVLETLAVVPVLNRYGKFYSHLRIAIKVHLLFSTVW